MPAISTQISTQISTPCIDVCVVEPASELCIGCGRTLNEIGRWSGLDEAQRLAIMAVLPARLAAHGPAQSAAAPPRRP